MYNCSQSCTDCHKDIEICDFMMKMLVIHSKFIMGGPKIFFEWWESQKNAWMWFFIGALQLLNFFKFNPLKIFFHKHMLEEKKVTPCASLGLNNEGASWKSEMTWDERLNDLSGHLVHNRICWVWPKDMSLQLEVAFTFLIWRKWCFLCIWITIYFFISNAR